MKEILIKVAKLIMIIITALMSIFIVFIVLGWLADRPMSDAEFERQLELLKKEQQRARKGPETFVITYEVTGTTSSVKVSYTNETGGTQQETVSLPWNHKCFVRGSFHAHIFAQNEEKKGTIRVRILLNDQEKKSSVSSGAFVIATASLMHIPPE